MKPLIAILVLGAAAIGGVYAFSRLAADPGKLMGVAFGIPNEGEIEMHTIISTRVYNAEPPRMNLRGRVLWQEWVQEHFRMIDDAGKLVPLRYKSSTDIIADLDLKGFPRGFLIAHLKQGGGYTMEYRPTVAGAERYGYSFTAPTEAVKVRRPLFTPAE